MSRSQWERFGRGLLVANVLLGGLLGGAWTAFAQAQKAFPTIARIEGVVSVLTPPAPGQKTGLVSLYGKTYATMPGKLGAEVGSGSVIQTGKDGKARLVYPGGDYLSVSPNSMFRVIARTVNTKSTYDLLSGSVRALMTKKGEGEDVEVRSRTAVMGVRGTDFHVAAWSEEGGSQVTVFRGAVAVAPRVEEPKAMLEEPKPVKPGSVAAPTPTPQAVMVTAGSTATQVAPPPPPPTPAPGTVATGKPTPTPAPPPMPVIRQTTKQELVVIQKETTVAKPVVQVSVAKPEEIAAIKKIEELEKKAAEATVVDIKKYDPDLYKKVVASGKPVVDADQVQSMTVRKIFEKAPMAEGKVAPEAQRAVPKKPTMKDLELPSDPYGDYK